MLFYFPIVLCYNRVWSLFAYVSQLMEERIMNEQQIAYFEQKLKELLAFARANQNVIEIGKVNDFFKELR